MKALKKGIGWIVFLLVAATGGAMGKVAVNYLMDQYIVGPKQPMEAMVSQQPPITGFRDLYFGDTLEDVIKKRKVVFVAENTWSSGKTQSFYDTALKADEEQTLFGIPIMPDMRIAFDNGKLGNIYIAFENTEENFQRLEKGFTQLYGEPMLVKMEDVLSATEIAEIKNFSKKMQGSPVHWTRGPLFWPGQKGGVTLAILRINDIEFIQVQFVAYDAAKAKSD